MHPPPAALQGQRTWSSCAAELTLPAGQVQVPGAEGAGRGWQKLPSRSRPGLTSSGQLLSCPEGPGLGSPKLKEALNRPPPQQSCGGSEAHPQPTRSSSRATRPVVQGRCCWA